MYINWNQIKVLSFELRKKNVRESFLIFKFCDDDGKKIETLKTSRKPQSMCG